MIICIDNLKINVEIEKKSLAENLIPAVFLHGFSGNAKDWRFIFKYIPKGYIGIAIDLIGHGKSSSPKDLAYYSTDKMIYFLDEIFKYLNFEKILLTGYSMGGRAALSYTLKYPQKVSKLVLESTSFGIKNEYERTARIEDDMKLGEKIKKEGLISFFNYWFDLPFFSNIKEIKGREFRKYFLKRIKSNTKTGLTNSLRGFSTGLMPDYWDSIRSLNNEVFLITGENDSKFTKIAEEANSILPHSIHKIIPGCGHNIHLEKPLDFIKLLKEFLFNLEKNI